VFMLYIYFFHTIFVPIKLVLQAVKQGDTIFAGQYLFTGSATTSVWLVFDYSLLSSSFIV
jgi:hypothetical protein